MIRSKLDTAGDIIGVTGSVIAKGNIRGAKSRTSMEETLAAFSTTLMSDLGER